MKRLRADGSRWGLMEEAKPGAKVHEAVKVHRADRRASCNYNVLIDNDTLAGIDCFDVDRLCLHCLGWRK